MRGPDEGGPAARSPDTGPPRGVPAPKAARFVLSRSAVRDRYSFMKGICPRVSYSLKTNPEVGRVLEEETDCMFSVHTVEGLQDLRDMGRVLFLVEGMGEEPLSGLIARGISRFVVDNEADLESLLRAAGAREIELFLRMRFHETTVYRGRFFMFGMSPERIERLIPELREDRRIRRLGIHFHRKSQNTGNWSLREMLQGMLSEETLGSIDMMNIGGGIPVAYKNTGEANLGYITGKIRELGEWLGSRGIEMIIEPGRSIAAPAVRLEARVTSVVGRDITMDCSVYNSSMDTIIVPLKMLVEGEGQGEAYTIKGCTPCSLDIFRYEVRLRPPRVGDRLVFLNAGAYNFTTDFCRLPRLETIVVD